MTTADDLLRECRDYMVEIDHAPEIYEYNLECKGCQLRDKIDAYLASPAPDMVAFREKIEQIDALAKKAAPEPWIADPDDRPGMSWNYQILQGGNPNLAVCFMAHDGDKYAEGNALLITALRNAWPQLRDAIRALPLDGGEGVKEGKK